MGEAVTNCLHTRFDDVPGRVKIGLSDLKVDDFLALSFENSGLGQNLESTFRAEVHNSGGYSHLFSSATG